MNDTSNLDHRELTDTELDTVSGGLSISKPLDAASPKLSEGGGGGNAGPAIAIWNTLLGQYGAA
jgi:bacteriocin-like protein